MSNPFIGEIRMFAGNFAPAGWAFCDGQLLPIAENDALFILIGTTYGGDGQETFALPNLQSRIPLHQGNGFILGETGGVEEVTLTVQQIPVHSHPLIGTTSIANDASPSQNVPAQTGTFDGFQSSPPNAAMAPQSVGPLGGSQPHTNFQPYLCINFIVALFGVFQPAN